MMFYRNWQIAPSTFYLLYINMTNIYTCSTRSFNPALIRDQICINNI